MRQKSVFLVFLAALTAAATTLPALAMDRVSQTALRAALQGEHRDAEAKARDVYRKPMDVLDFLGFQSDMTVVEIWPGGGWYTEVLAPALADRGKLYAAQFSLNPPAAFQRRAMGAFLLMLGKAPKLYRNVTVTQLAPPYELRVAPPESADMVLTFRNVHNWVMELSGGGKYAHLYFEAMFDALKPGGVLGVVDHHWPDPASEDALAKNGYISVERTVAMAKAAGFELVAQSDLLANPNDTHNHEKGVWSLPPTFALGDKSRAKYKAIGESDRFLLKFRKPKPHSKR